MIANKNSKKIGRFSYISFYSSFIAAVFLLPLCLAGCGGADPSVPGAAASSAASEASTADIATAETAAPASGTADSDTPASALPDGTAFGTQDEDAGKASAHGDEAVASSGTMDKVASAEDMTEVIDVTEDGMEPVYAAQLKEGSYAVEMESSSSMFKADHCELEVSEDGMEAVLYMSSTAYPYMFAGTAQEAAAADEDAYIPLQEETDGFGSFRLPVGALDQGIPFAAYSKRKGLWYDRTLLFRADSLPLSAFRDGYLTTLESLGLSDGEYTVEVSLSGGSGRASIASPAKLTVSDGTATAEIIFSSSHYDYMKVDGETYLPVSTEGNSTFAIPVLAFDYAMPVLADTTAMSKPHEVRYTLRFDASSIQKEAEGKAQGVKFVESLPLQYAREFSADKYSDGSVLIRINGAGSFLLLPEGAEVPSDLSYLKPAGDSDGQSQSSGQEDSGDVAVLQQPLKNIYLAASSAMDLFLQLDALGKLRFTSTKAEDWGLPEAREAISSGELVYAGKYSAPDFELLLSGGCPLAIESTMIYHSPDIKEKLESLGIPVLVERSSYEAHPLGRVEWIKLYGLLTGQEDAAEDFFNALLAQLPDLQDADAGNGAKQTAAFFYINTAGAAVVRRPGDYVSKMIALAGGEYVLSDTRGGEDDAGSTMNMQMESFYGAAKDADVLIYNSSIDGEISSLSQLLEKSSLLSHFKAVQEGNVWCTEQDMFQKSSAAAGIIQDFHAIFSGEAEDQLAFFHRLR